MRRIAIIVILGLVMCIAASALALASCTAAMVWGLGFKLGLVLGLLAIGILVVVPFLVERFVR